MKKYCALSLLGAFCTLMVAGWTEAASATGATHTVFIRINSDPQGALLFAPGASNGAPDVVLGETPYILAVKASWPKKSWVFTRWGAIQLESEGNACRAEYDKRGNCVLMLDLVASKPGYQTERFELPAVSLSQPGSLWSGREEWPIKATVELLLDPVEEAVEKTPPPPSAAATVVVASSAEGAERPISRLHMMASEENCTVVVNEEILGRTPLNLVIPAGVYSLEIRKEGFAPFKESLNVTGGTEETLKAILVPLNE